MKGVVFLGDRQLTIHDFPDPAPGPGEVVVQMKASGMCGSDLNTYRPARPNLDPTRYIIAGHEPCGMIVERGPGVLPERAPIGARVMIHHYSGCGKCKHCLVGYAQMCLKGGTTYGVAAHGGHAEYMLVKDYMLVDLPDDLTFEEGAAISCGSGTAYLALRRLDVSGRDTLAIFGQGPVGLSATMMAKAMGAQVIAVDLAPERLDLAKEFGADHVINPASDEPVQAIRDLTRGEGAQATLDCTGKPEARLGAVRAARSWGRVCFVGEGNHVTIEVSPDMLRKQLTIYGSWTFSTVGQAECAEFVIDHKLPLGRLLSERFTLDQAAAAYQRFDTQTTGKGVFLL